MFGRSQIAIAAVAGCMWAAAGASAADWQQYGYSARHASVNSSETVLTRSTVGTLAVAASPTFGTDAPTSPIVAGTRTFVGAGPNVLALDAATGAAVWSRSDCSAETAAQPAAAGGRVFVGDAGGDLAAYDAATGTQAWCGDAGGSIVSAPAVAGSMVYVTNGSSIIAASQSTGFARWRFDPTDGPITSTPAVGGGMVVATGGGHVYAVSSTDGHLLWERDLGGSLSAAAISGSTAVYVGGTDSMYALRASGGTTAWQRAGLGGGVTTPAVYGSRLYASGQGLWAINSGTGAILWHDTRPGASAATVSIAGGVAYEVAQSGGLELFDPASGRLIKTISRPYASGPGLEPAIANGAVYASTANGLDILRKP